MCLVLKIKLSRTKAKYNITLLGFLRCIVSYIICCTYFLICTTVYDNWPKLNLWGTKTTMWLPNAAEVRFAHKGDFPNKTFQILLIDLSAFHVYMFFKTIQTRFTWFVKTICGAGAHKAHFSGPFAGSFRSKEKTKELCSLNKIPQCKTMQSLRKCIYM